MITLISSKWRVLTFDIDDYDDDDGNDNVEDDDNVEIQCSTRITNKMLGKVIKYCKKHVKAAAFSGANENARSSDDAVKSWDADFVKPAVPTHCALAAMLSMRWTQLKL